MTPLRLLSGGAAQGLVTALEPAFRTVTGLAIAGTFGAVGAMRAKLHRGDPADLVILTSAIVRELGDAGIVIADSIADIGRVATAIAVRGSAGHPDVSDAEALRRALLAADAIYYPDPQQATAGIHFAGVLQKLGIADATRERLRAFPNGATAMASLAKAPEANPIGCTQVTEILATPGISLVAPLPPGCDLETTYAAGAVAASGQRGPARALIGLLTAVEHAGVRAKCGFA
jgi:molybdate transport system substrate-binding protein